MPAEMNYFGVIISTLALGGTALTLMFYIIYSNKREMAYRKQAESALKKAKRGVLKKISDDELLQNFSDRFALMYGEVIGESSRAANHFISLLTNLSKEKFGVIYLNANSAFIHSEVLFEGSLTMSAIYPRELIKRALELNAAAIIIGHNHPSGSVSPNEGDIKVTQAIRQACGIMEIKFHDHIIIGNGRWFSFRATGML